MATRPVDLPLTSQLLVRIMDLTSSWSQRHALASAFALFGAAVALDHWFGGAFSVTFMYFAACAFAVWCLGERGGMAMTMLSVIASAIIKHEQVPLLVGHPISPLAEVWNLAGRILSFLMFGTVVNGLRAVLAAERWRGSHDGLTGALNKAGFEQARGRAITRAQAKGNNLLLAYMDLDGFKAVNDQHGHAAGDRVLTAFGTAAAEAIRPTDLFARIGGDEFAALLTLPPGVDGDRVAELLHGRLSAILAQTGFDVTCSMGAVVMASDDAADGGMMEQADALMYEVKRSGKNALRVARRTKLTHVLRSAYQPIVSDDLDELLRRIERAERPGDGTLLRAA